MERPDIPPESVERQFLTIANYVFTVTFAIEMGIKVCPMSALCPAMARIQLNATSTLRSLPRDSS